jgi:hypothetical protein
MAISTVSICNRALDLLGADPIISLDDGSKAANLCQRNFAATADSVLRLYPWNAAMRRASLPALGDAPAWGYVHQYQLPEGPDPAPCLRLIRVESGEAFRVEGKRVLTDYAAPLNILYIGRILDPAEYDPLLAEAISAKLAVHLAGNLTESASRIEAMRDYLKNILAGARAVDAQEGGAEAIEIDAWLAARS